jgi:hypothetical protein
MTYGLDPADPSFTHLQLVPPGDKVDVKLLEVNLPFMKTALEELGHPKAITHAQIRLDTVTFIDGTQWAGNVVLYPDPKPLQKFNPMIPDRRQAPEEVKPALTSNETQIKKTLSPKSSRDV